MKRVSAKWWCSNYWVHISILLKIIDWEMAEGSEMEAVTNENQNHLKLRSLKKKEIFALRSPSHHQNEITVIWEKILCFNITTRCFTSIFERQLLSYVYISVYNSLFFLSADSTVEADCGALDLHAFKMERPKKLSCYLQVKAVQPSATVTDYTGWGEPEADVLFLQ